MKIEPIPTPEDLRDSQGQQGRDLGRALALRITRYLAGQTLTPGASFAPTFLVAKPYPVEVLRRAEDLLGHNGWGKVEIRQHADDALRLCVLLEVGR